MFTLIATLATVSGTLSAFLPTFQIRQMLAQRSSRGVSVPFVCGIIANLVIWAAYGAALHKPVMFGTCGASLLTNAVMLLVALRMRRPQRRH